MDNETPVGQLDAIHTTELAPEPFGADQAVSQQANRPRAFHGCVDYRRRYHCTRIVGNKGL